MWLHHWTNIILMVITCQVLCGDWVVRKWVEVMVITLNVTIIKISNVYSIITTVFWDRNFWIKFSCCTIAHMYLMFGDELIINGVIYYRHISLCTFNSVTDSTWIHSRMHHYERSLEDMYAHIVIYEYENNNVMNGLPKRCNLRVWK